MFKVPRFASAGTGSIVHMGAELLVAMFGTKMLHVPCKGVAEAYPAVMSGDVNWMIGFPLSALPLVKAGRLKAIAGSPEEFAREVKAEYAKWRALVKRQGMKF